jgi:hypothetical protein
LIPMMAFAVLLPIPWLNFWVHGAGRAFAFVYLFLGCSLLAGESFRSPVAGTSAGRRLMWDARMLALALAGAVVALTFTGAYWAVSGRVDVAVLELAVLTIIPALGCVPYVTLRAGNPFVGILFTASLLVLIKLLGCVVARFVYGPNAQAEGQMAMSWAEPNLLVWFCLAGGMLLSLALYILGRRAYVGPEAEPSGRPVSSAITS